MFSIGSFKYLSSLASSSTAYISKLSLSDFFYFSKFRFLTLFSAKKCFLRPKTIKIQDVFSIMAYDVSNQTTLYAHDLFELYNLKKTFTWPR